MGISPMINLSYLFYFSMLKIENSELIIFFKNE